jgi:energy-coupling factor transporter transmembrane protein EcfT
MLFAANVFEEVAFGLRNYGISEKDIPQKVSAALESVGLVGKEEVDPFVMTKGERQKLAVACVLACEPEVLILDESTTGLDAQEQIAMMDLLTTLNRAGHTVVIVTHSEQVVAAYARRVVLLDSGKIIGDGTARGILSRPDLLSRTSLIAPPCVRLGCMYGLSALTVPELARAGGNLVRVYKLMILLFVMSAVLWSFFYKGQTALCTLGPLVIMKESLLYGITIGIRLNCFVLAAIIFLASTPIEDFTYGLSKLGIPFAVSFALTLAFRLTPLFIETGQAIVMAQKARGLDRDSGGILRGIRHYVPIIVPVLASRLRRADQLAVALESRGFGKGKKRSVISEFRITWRDYVLLSVVFLAGALMALYRFV